MEKKKTLLLTIILVTFIAFVTTKTNYKNKDIEQIKEDNNIKSIAVKQSDDGENYTNVNTVPTSGYTLNTDKTKCFVNDVEDTAVTVTYENGKVSFSNLTQNETKCNLYFDKEPITVDNIIDTLNAKTTAPTFTSPATGNEGVYATSDGMYGGTTYYWRGAVTNNYVTFAGFCWRIIRINGDGSIRLIYDGTTCHANGTYASESIAIPSTAYNSYYDDSSYVGWSYMVWYQRPNNTNPQTSGTRAPIRVTLEDTWYKTNITDKGYDGKVATGKFCNDRNTKNNEEWRGTGADQYYAAYPRLLEETIIPTTSCPSGDVYEVKVGLITADEVTFAGASGRTSNTKYYLYNGQYYWTMSPSWWHYKGAYVFFVDSSGCLGDGDTYADGVFRAYGVRPVINLNADTQFQTGGNGTYSKPYVVL